MKKQKKLDDGLNRLFSTPRKSAPPPPEEPQPTPPSDVQKSPMQSEVKTPKRKTKVENQIQETSENRIPPQSHLIPVPQRPSLPLQMPDIGSSEDIISEEELETAINLPLIPVGQDTTQVTNRTETAQAPKKSLEANPTPELIQHSPGGEQKESVTTAEGQTPATPQEIVPHESDGALKKTNETGIRKVGVSEFSDEQIVIFTLARQSYGVNIAVVDGIIKMQPITVVPRAPHYIVGVTNLRGIVVPVISLHKRLDIIETEKTEDSRIIIVNSHGIIAGMLVDEVNAVELVKGSDIENVSQTLTAIDSAYIRAIAKLEGKLVILLELDKVLQQNIGAKAHIR